MFQSAYVAKTSDHIGVHCVHSESQVKRVENPDAGYQNNIFRRIYVRPYHRIPTLNVFESTGSDNYDFALTEYLWRRESFVN